MPTLKEAVPKYRHHKATGQAVVTIQGHDHYLGPWRSKASKVEYDRLVGEWLAAGRPTTPHRHETDLTVVELIARYMRFVRQHYVKNGKPTSEQASICNALRWLRRLYGRTPAVEFGPLALKSIRQQMIDSRLARTNINALMGRIRRMFKWAASEELVPITVFQSVATVTGIRKGRTDAKETKPIMPVEDSVVDETLQYLPTMVADMVRFQRLTGCRPAEVCSIRPCDIDTSRDVWEYRPESHKTEHHDRERVVFIGPQCQAVLDRYLLRPPESYCFSPAESEKKRLAERHESRMVPLSCGNKPGTNRKRRPRRVAGDRYDTSSYRRAIHRACDKAGIERWSPNRLRHATATLIRRQFGLEAAQVTLGHAAADVTQVYAERDMAKAAAVMREIG